MSPPRKREATPDLTDVVSVLHRKRRLTQWDIKPPGYENVTAEQAKLSGMFPLPGAPRQQPMDPSRLQAFMNQSTTGSADAASLKPSHSRQAKRLFVYNIPPNVTGEALLSFFNLQLNGLNVVQSVDPCISAQVSDDHSFALLEFKSPNEATVALAFDGITMDEHASMDGAGKGEVKGLEVRRPKDYIVPNGSADQEYQEGVLLNEVPDSPNKICVSNIPQYIQEEAVIMLLKSFGELKSFVLVKDASTEESRGIAFCEYADPTATSIAVEGLNGMEIGDRPLKVVRASIGMTQAAGLDMGVNAMSMFAKTTSQDLETSRVLQLLNMVTAEELIDNDDYEEICEDVREECSKYGQVLELKVPRPSGGSRQSPGVGKIFVKFDTVESATKALKALAGRKFSDRTVVTTYYGERYQLAVPTMALPLYIPLCMHTPPGKHHFPPLDKPLRIQIEGPLVAIQRLLPDISWRLDLPDQTFPQPAGPELARLAYQKIYGRDVCLEVSGDLLVRDEYLGSDDPNPEVLQINIIEIGDDHGIYANQWLLFAVDPEEFIGKKVLAVPRCCQKRKGTQDRWRVNASVDQRVNGYEQLKGPEDIERYLKT
ncbi:hypothetical protein ATERTT37_004851 [Aspergillus terreus]